MLPDELIQRQPYPDRTSEVPCRTVDAGVWSHLDRRRDLAGSMSGQRPSSFSSSPGASGDLFSAWIVDVDGADDPRLVTFSDEISDSWR